MSEKQHAPLMPVATAVWLVDNTSLSFEQIAEFCHLHILEVLSIADGDGAKGIRGLNPVIAGQLTEEEIALATEDPTHQLRVSREGLPAFLVDRKKKGKVRKYTPISRRHDRPNAILWLLRFCPNLSDAAVVRLVRTTRNTVQQIRERTHRDISNLVPKDPVGLGLCTQVELDLEVGKVSEHDAELTELGQGLDADHSIIRPDSDYIMSPADLFSTPQKKVSEIAEYDNLSSFGAVKTKRTEETDDS